MRSNTDIKEWRYLNTKNNPADHASTGLNSEELMKSNWFSGPAFLWEKEISSGEERIPDIQIGDPEVMATVRTTKVKESFSLIDSVSYLKRPFKKNKPRTVTTTVAEQRDAEMLIPKRLKMLYCHSRTCSAAKV